MGPIKPSVYALGTQPPILKLDPGAGAWKSQPVETKVLALKALLTGRIDGLPPAAAGMFQPLLALQLTGLSIQFAASRLGGDDAVKHLLHYLGNTGNKYAIDFQGLINEVPIAKRAYEVQLDAAKKFVETLPPGRHSFTSTTGSLNHPIGESDSVNWFFAVGSYSTWGRGVATVQTTSGKLQLSMDYEYHFFDRYNWDGGKSVLIPIPGLRGFSTTNRDLLGKLATVINGQLLVTDANMAKFHKQGLAKEFDMVGMLKKTVQWTSVAIATHTVRSGDTLSSIAKQYYGDTNKWTVVHNANKSTVPNPSRIQIGQVLKIPR